MCHNAPEILFSQMTQKCGFIKILWDIIQEKDDQYKDEGLNLNQTPTTIKTNSNKILTDSKVKAAKIMMGFIRYQRKVYSSITTPSPVLPVSRSGHVNKSALDELIHQIGIALGSLPPSMASYSSLLEIVLGKFKLNMPSHSTGIISYTTERIQIDNLGNSNLNDNNDNNNGNNSQSQPSSPSIQPSFNKNSMASQSLSLIPLVSDKDQINLVGALEGLMKLISESSYRIRTRMLMDILSLVKTSDHNQKLFCRQRNEWDKWMVNLISLECGNDDASACNQLVSQIAATIVWRFLMKDDKGWISVMQLLESLNRKILHLIRADKKKQQQQLEKSNDEQKASENSNDTNGSNKTQQQQHKITQETKLKCRVLHEFLVQVLVLVLNRFLMNQLRSDHDPNNRGRSSNSGSNMNDLTDSSENIKNRTSKNLISILDITEWVLFNHRFSMLSIPRIRLKQDAKESDITAEMLFDTKDSDTEWQPDEIRNEILLLKRLLSCSLKFISFKNERQLVLRRLLRYLKEILPHKACHLCFDDCINAAREFCNRLQNGGNANHKKKGTKINMKSENNMKTMRIAYSFLKNAYLRYNKRGDTKRAFKIRALQEEVYAFWGPMLFEDKIDPNTANQMNLELVLAEQSLENVQHHIHSLWVFLQHQKWWEYQFQDKNMKKFKIEYSNHEKEEKKKLMTNREQFDRYYTQCRTSFELVSNDELKRLTESKESKRKKKRDITRDLKKYMDFFDEDFQCRFPNENTPDFWELDPRESSNNHTRLLLVRNFKGTSHSHAAVELTHARKRAKSKTASSRRSSLTNKSISKPPTPSDSNRQGPPATLLKQISHGIMKDLNLDDDGTPRNKPLLQERQSIESIPEEKEKFLTEEKTSLHDRNIGSMESIISAASMTSESDLYSNINENDEFNIDDNEDDDGGENEEEAKGYQSANLSGKKILLSLDAVSISPFFKISGKMYVTEHHLIFEGHEYKENVHEQNAKDQIKLTKQRYDREKKTLLISNDEELIKQLESENKQQEEMILAQKETTTSDIIEYEIWSLAHIKHLYPRRYLLRENGLEIWIAGTSKSFFFTFANTKKRGEVINIICKHSPRFLKQNATKDLLVSPLKMLKHLGLTEKWQKRKISNFDYLMELNVLAGRSYNDITQYPVFPWVITDFQSDTIDINDPNIYRDLSKPIGALNEDRLEIFRQRYQDSKEDTSDSFPPFYYGSHYMSAGIALYYLCRMEPFATLYINLHGGRFEIPDRTFYSILNAWDLSLNNMGDVKEMIPEAYYFPEFLRNVNKFPLGYRTMGGSKVNVDENPESGRIDNVDLPPWANKSPEEFVRIMREALESDYVSANLHNWIDLIFGYKQRGDESVAAHNVFFYLTYAGAVDPDSISDPTIKAATEQQIYHFGQTPNILFHQPHPQRLQKERCHWLCELYLPYEMDNTIDSNKNKIEENSPLPDTPNTPSTPVGSDIVWAGQQPQHKNQVAHVNQPIIIKNKPFVICEFKPVEQPSHLNIIRNGQLLKLFDTTERILTFELPMLAYLDPSQPNKSTQLRNIIDATATQVPPELPIFELMPPDWSDSIVYNTFVLSQNGLYGITGGYLDGSIKIHWLKDGSTLASVTGLENGHNDIITCLALDHTSQDMLISGAKDGSIVYWTALLKNNKPGRTPLIGKPYRLLSIHYDAVRVIAVNSKVGIIVSAADDGTIALYSIARKRFVREILFEGRKNNDVEESKTRDDDMLREVIKIQISNTGYIIIHSIDETIPYLRVMSINGILIKKLRLNEILFSLKTDATGKILITGGQACKIIFRHIHNLEIIQEITIIENQRKKKLFKKPNHSKKLTSTIINQAILSPAAKSRITHSSAWRQQRFSFKSGHSGHARKPSINDELFGQRKHVLKSKRDKEEKENKNKNKKRLSNPYLASPRISTHFHGRFASVDGQTILSQSRIIDFDLDPDNTFIIVVMLNLDPKHTDNEHKAQLLLYPLPNSRHIHQFDQFVNGSNKVLQTAKRTIWENIINVIESENGLNELNTFQFPGSPNLPDLYLQSNSSNNSAKGGLGDGAKKFISGLKNVTDKIGKKHKDKNRDKDKDKEDKNKDKDNDDNNNVISEKFNQFRSFLGGGGKK